MDVKETAKSRIQAAIDVLLDSAADKNQVVAENVNTALRKIAKKRPNDVLNSCCRFYKRNSKLSKEQISEVLDTMEHICQEQIMDIDGDTIIMLIEFVMDTMIQNATYEPVIQLPASGVLVAIGGKHSIQIIEALLNKLEIGIIPHYTIPYTLGSLASCNAFGIVPYLKRILEILLPLLAMVKLDHHKNAIAYSLGRFSEAIGEYMLNLDQAPDPTITSSIFYTEMGIAYDILSNSWLYSKEPKVTEAVLLSMSSIFSVLSAEKVNQQTQRVIPVLLNLYKKQKEPLPITQCLGAVIQVATVVNGTLLEPLLASVLHTLSELVCIAPDYAQPELLRNHSEVLRCYERLAMHFTDNCLDYLVMQLRNNNDKEKVKALLVLTHLANSLETTVRSRLDVFLQVLADLLHDQNLRIKKAVLKTIVVFAYKGFLPQHSEQKYLEFIVKLCCKPQFLSKNSDFDQQELSDLQTTADNTLYMLSTSVIELEGVLWNLLLACFLSSEYTDSCITLLRCLTHLASRKNNTDACEAAFVRCLALLAQPLSSFRGTFILNFLKNITLCQSATYRPVWDSKLPHLIKYLEQNYDNFQYKEWEDLIFDFLILIIQAVNDETFNKTLVTEAKKQLSLYDTKPVEKCLLLKCLAIIVCHIKSEPPILEVLNAIIEMIKLNSHELSACTEAIGICSRSHLKLVISKLDAIRKEILGKKSNKLLHFNFMNSQKNEAEIERVRLMVLASYAEICNEAPGDILLQSIQHDILDFAVNELNNCKDFLIRHACLKTIGAVADALHPNRNTLHIQMRDRNEVLTLVSSQIQLHNGPEYIELYPVTLPVITSLVRLPPALESEQRVSLLKHCFTNIFNAAAIYCRINTENSPSTYFGELKLSPSVYTSFSKLNFVVQELLMQTLSPATLDEIVTLLEPWLGRKRAEQRLPALETLRDALQAYLDNVKFAYEGPTTFTQSGFLLARVVPRCTDPNRNIRKVGVEALRLTLCITARYEGHMWDHDKTIGQSLQHIQEQIDSDKPKLLFNLTTDLAHSIISHIPHLQLPHFVNNLMDALLDVESSSSSGSSVVLNTVLKNKGGELLPHVGDLLNKLLSTLDRIQCVRTRSSALRSVLSLAVHHPKIVIGIILSHALPYEQYINDCWAVLSTDVNLVCDILDQFKNIFKNCIFYEDHPSMDNLRIVTLQPLQAISAMTEIFKNNQLQETCRQQFPELYSILYITLASYIETAAPATSSKTVSRKEKYSFVPNREAYRINPTNVCLESLKFFLLCAGYTTIAETLLSGIHLDKLDQFLNLVPTLIESVCANAPQTLAWLVTCLVSYSRSEVEAQRVAVAAFLASAIKYRPTDQNVLSENILEMLLLTQTDSSCLVRQVGLQGLGFAVENLNSELLIDHYESILNAFMQGLDYNNISNESGVALEAMLSFSKLLKVTDGHRLRSCQVTAAMRIKPLFEQEDGLLRDAAFRLLGDLAASINQFEKPEAFKEQACGCLITLLLHLCDDDPEVVKACKYSLRKIAPFLESSKVNSMIQDHLPEEGNLHYSDFVADLVKAMSKELLELFPLFLMTCVSYFKSSWVEIRSYAALLVGLLCSHLNDEIRKEVSFDTICHRLLQLLKDENHQVRTRAVQATAYLFVI